MQYYCDQLTLSINKLSPFNFRYQRGGSWHFERIKALEFTNPDIFRRFLLGQWVIQERPGWFIAVAPDQKHEQTGQRVSKGPGGHFVVGATHQVALVAEFEILYHDKHTRSCNK